MNITPMKCGLRLAAAAVAASAVLTTYALGADTWSADVFNVVDGKFVPARGPQSALVKLPSPGSCAFSIRI